MDLNKFKETYKQIINESTDNIVEEVEIEEETDPTKMSIRQLEKYLMDELTKHHKAMEPWANELRRKQDLANKKKSDLWKGHTEPGKSGPDFGPRGPLG